MADAKISELVSKASPDGADLAVIVDNAGTPETKQATLASLMRLLTRKQAVGSSSSSTPGTAIASITAAANHVLIGWNVFAANPGLANTNLTVTITYTDDTTATLDTTAGSGSFIQGNAGGLTRITSGALSAATSGLDKAVKDISVVTAGTGTGSRAASISAIEIPA